MPESQSSNIPRLMLVLILSLSAFVQFTVVSRTVVDYPLRADAGEYFSYAYNLHNFGVYSGQRPQSDAAPPTSLIPDKARSPGYPLFLLSLGAPEPTDAYLRRVCFVQAFLGVLSVWLVFLISATFLGHGPGLAVALLAAVSPHLATMSTYLLTESLFTFLLLGSVFTLLKAVESQKRWLYAVTGVIWGLCALVRPTAEYFPALLLLLVLALPRLRHYKSNAILAFACFLLVLSPWVIRNRSGAVSNPESNLMVNTLAHGSYPGFMYDSRPETFGFPYRFDPRINDITRDLPSILKHIAGKFRAEPLVYTQWYLLGKPLYFLSWGNVQASDVLIYPAIHTPYYEDLRFALMRLLGLALHWPLMILGLAGAAMAVLRPRWLRLEPPAARAAAITALLVAYAIALHMIVAPFPRYAIPFRPFIYALAALPLREAWLALRAGRARFRNPPPSGSL